MFETLQPDGNIFGFTTNYIKVKITGTMGLENSILQVKLKQPENFYFTKADLV